MGDIINLRRARKSKLRADKDVAATANRAKFGQSPAEKRRLSAQVDRDNKALDGHLLPQNKDPS